MNGAFVCNSTFFAKILFCLLSDFFIKHLIPLIAQRRANTCHDLAKYTFLPYIVMVIS